MHLYLNNLKLNVVLCLFSTLLFSCNFSTEHTENNISIASVKKDTIICQHKDKIVKKTKYSEIEQELLNFGLVDIKDYSKSIQVNLIYSTDTNFLSFDIYKELNSALMQKACAEKLIIAEKTLKALYPNYKIIIYDAVRPLSVQKVMWDSVKVPDYKKHWYVANPNRGSIHNYGMGVDVTILDSLNNSLDMGTPFDYFGKLAHTKSEQSLVDNNMLTLEQKQNRELLYEIMESSGFTVGKTEWWHYFACSINYAKQHYKIIE